MREEKLGINNIRGKMKMREATIYSFHLSILLYGLINPAAEREPESALVLSSKLVHHQLCVHLDPGKFPASGLLMLLDGCILNVTQECWSPLWKQGWAALLSICSTNHELMFPPSKVFCQTSLNSKYHSYIHPVFGYTPTLACIKATFYDFVLLKHFILSPSCVNISPLRKGN